MLKSFEEKLLVLMLILMTLILGMQIVARYLFKNSIVWSEELVRYLFIWSTFIGIPYCINKGKSLKVTQIIEKLPENVVNIILLIDSLIILAFFVTIFIGGIIVTKNSYINHQLSPALGIPMWTVNLSVPVGAFLSIIRILGNIVNDKEIKF